jgi:hypothetical protein
MAKWTLTDNSTGSPVVYTFPINPITFEHPGRKANFTAETTTGNTGGTILFQGRDEVPTLSFGGLVNSATFYTELRAELDKWYDLVLTDDQGATWNVIVTDYSFRRKKSALNQHRYEYKVTCKVLS